MILILLETASRPPVELFWKANSFDHFNHVYNLMRDCNTRVEMLLKKNNRPYFMPKDVIVKIGIVGDYTKDNVNLISKRAGRIYSHNIYLLKKTKQISLFFFQNL